MLAPETTSARWLSAAAAPEKRMQVLVVRPAIAVIVLLAVAYFLDDPVLRALKGGMLGGADIHGYLTVLGKSDWLLIPSLAAGLFALMVLRLPLSYSWRWAARGLGWLSGYIFVSIAFSGIVVVVLKRIIGRARPMYIEDVGVFDFTPFEIIDWSLHSFPSGHATTAFAFVVVATTLTRGRLVWPLWLLGIMIGISRIVLGDHFLSDIIAGSFVGYFCAVLVRDWFATHGWSMRIDNGHARYRYTPFAPLWRAMRRGQLPRVLK